MPEGVGHVEAIAPSRALMRVNAGVLFVLFSLVMTPLASAHEPKEYTILLKDNGVTPNGVSPGILVSSDSLFFYNADNRENVTHRILIDVEGDGNFEGGDDIITSWLSPSCELNETGEKIDQHCQVTYLLLLSPSNGLLPSNISMKHQIDNNGTIDESFFVVFFSEDNHISDQELPIGTEEQGELDSGNDQLLRLILISSLLGIVIFLPRLFSSNE